MPLKKAISLEGILLLTNFTKTFIILNVNEDSIANITPLSTLI